MAENIWWLVFRELCEWSPWGSINRDSDQAVVDGPWHCLDFLNRVCRHCLLAGNRCAGQAAPAPLMGWEVVEQEVKQSWLSSEAGPAQWVISNAQLPSCSPVRGNFGLRQPVLF